MHTCMWIPYHARADIPKMRTKNLNNYAQLLLAENYFPISLIACHTVRVAR